MAQEDRLRAVLARLEADSQPSEEPEVVIEVDGGLSPGMGGMPLSPGALARSLRTGAAQRGSRYTR